MSENSPEYHDGHFSPLVANRPTVEGIKRVVAAAHGLTLHDLESPCRERRLARPRQTAMFLARTMTPRSYPEIGRRFGNRDHTTVMHAVKAVRARLAKDQEEEGYTRALAAEIARPWNPSVNLQAAE